MATTPSVSTGKGTASIEAAVKYLDVGGELPRAFIVGRRFPLHQVFGHRVAIAVQLLLHAQDLVDLRAVGVAFLFAAERPTLEAKVGLPTRSAKSTSESGSLNMRRRPQEESVPPPRLGVPWVLLPLDAPCGALHLGCLCPT